MPRLSDERIAQMIAVARRGGDCYAPDVAAALTELRAARVALTTAKRLILLNDDMGAVDVIQTALTRPTEGGGGG